MMAVKRPNWALACMWPRMSSFHPSAYRQAVLADGSLHAGLDVFLQEWKLTEKPFGPVRIAEAHQSGLQQFEWSSMKPADQSMLKQAMEEGVAITVMHYTCESLFILLQNSEICCQDKEQPWLPTWTGFQHPRNAILRKSAAREPYLLQNIFAPIGSITMMVAEVRKALETQRLVPAWIDRAGQVSVKMGSGGNPYLAGGAAQSSYLNCDSSYEVADGFAHALKDQAVQTLAEAWDQDAEHEQPSIERLERSLTDLGVQRVPDLRKPKLAGVSERPDIICQLLLLQKEAFARNNTGHQLKHVTRVLTPKMHGLLAYLGSLLRVTEKGIEAPELIGWRNLREEEFMYNIVPVMVMNQQHQVAAHQFSPKILLEGCREIDFATGIVLEFHKMYLSSSLTSSSAELSSLQQLQEELLGQEDIIDSVVMQGYYVLHANLGLIPKPKDNIYSVREGLCTLFQRWSTAAKLASASGWHSHSELRCSPRLDALLLHTYESSSALQNESMGTVMLPWLAQQLNRLAVPAYICLMESRSKKRYKDLTWSQADAVLKHAADSNEMAANRAIGKMRGLVQLSCIGARSQKRQLVLYDDEPRVCYDARATLQERPCDVVKLGAPQDAEIVLQAPLQASKNTPVWQLCVSPSLLASTCLLTDAEHGGTALSSMLRMQPDGRLLDPAAKPTAQGETFVKHVLERLAEAYCSILGLQSSKIIKRLSKRLLEVVLAAFEQVRGEHFSSLLDLEDALGLSGSQQPASKCLRDDEVTNRGQETPRPPGHVASRPQDIPQAGAEALEAASGASDPSPGSSAVHSSPQRHMADSVAVAVTAGSSPFKQKPSSADRAKLASSMSSVLGLSEWKSTQVTCPEELDARNREARAGEEAAWRMIMTRLPQAQVVWVNQSEETGKPYDIQVSGLGSLPYYIEVKTTTIATKSFVEMSPNEVAMANEHRSQFVLLRLWGHLQLGDASAEASPRHVYLCIRPGELLGHGMVRAALVSLAKSGQGLATQSEQQFGRATQNKSRDFFREVCRLLPWTVNNYKLNELITVKELRSNVHALFKQNAHVTNPGVIDVMIYKGREELEMVNLQHKQRHHLITEYVARPQELKRQLASNPQGSRSKFLEGFYTGAAGMSQGL
ncbi:hypothetical protein WJX84_011878 [Apatococcus fuscideae]|uniref:Protein NO VEIN C-terminal domain-containing protein n=1 Tax=Apatococcus fuscideae TaxID=2026836 RepID=A0AAW1TGC1_9CHLO